MDKGQHLLNPAGPPGSDQLAIRLLVEPSWSRVIQHELLEASAGLFQRRDREAMEDSRDEVASVVRSDSAVGQPLGYGIHQAEVRSHEGRGSPHDFEFAFVVYLHEDAYSREQLGEDRRGRVQRDRTSAVCVGR